MDKSIGIELREARREKGMGLPEVSSVLCISKTYLRGLEECNKDQLPDSAFAIGFLRTYAEYLGLNADDLVARAKQEPAKGLDGAPDAANDAANDDTGGKAAKGKENKPKEGGIIEPLKSHDSSMPAIPLVITVIAGVMSLAVAIGFYEPSRTSIAGTNLPPADTVETIETSQRNDHSSSVSVATPVALEEMLAPDHTQTQPQEQAQAQDQSQTQVEIVAANDAWISLRDANDLPLYRNVLSKGERYSFPTNGAVHLATGHPENIQVFVDGRKVQAPTHQGRVVRDWRINAESDSGGFDQGDGNISEQ